MKPFFEDHGEVEHVIGLTQNPGFNVTLADKLRDHAIAAGVPDRQLDGGLPHYEPGCDADGIPLDPAHPWNGGPGYGCGLNSRQQAIVDALESARAGRDMSAPLWALHAVEADTAVTALAPAAAHGKKFQGRKTGAVGPIAKRVAAHLKKNPSATAIEVWARSRKDRQKDSDSWLARYSGGTSRAARMRLCNGRDSATSFPSKGQPKPKEGAESPPDSRNHGLANP